MRPYYNMIRFFYLLLLFSFNTNGATLLILGDSLSASYGIEEEYGWVQLLEQEISPKYRIVNASVSGDTTGNGLARLPKLLKEFKPDYVLIELGANDGLRGHPLRIIRSNITKMIALCENYNAQPLLFGMKIPANYGSRYSKGFEEIYYNIAAMSQIPMMPFQFTDIATTLDMIQADGLHPSLKAQPIIKNRVKLFLMPILKIKTNP